jgi:hypothetical protein
MKLCATQTASGDAMDLLAEFMALEVVVLLAGLGSLVGYRLLTGQINTANLLGSKELGGLSATRIQLLLVSLGAAAAYTALAIEAVRQGAPELPAVPGLLLLVVGGSHATYLGWKGYVGMSTQGRRSGDAGTKGSAS